MREGRKEGECENERKGVEIGGLKSELRLQFCFVLFSFFLFYYYYFFLKSAFLELSVSVFESYLIGDKIVETSFGNKSNG